MFGGAKKSNPILWADFQLILGWVQKRSFMNRDLSGARTGMTGGQSLFRWSQLPEVWG